MSSVHDGHRRRMKQQFSEHGGESMNDIQFLEMLLYYAIPRSDTNELSHALLERYGTIRGVLDADEADMQKLPGVGESTVRLLKTVKEALRRYVSSQTQEKAFICSSSDAGRYFVPLLQFETEEKVYLMCLNGRGGVISCAQIGSGTFRDVRLMDHIIVAEGDYVSFAQSGYL